MKKIILSALLGLAIVVSCEKKQEIVTDQNNDIASTEQNVTDDHANHDDHEKSEDHDESVKLELNNGEKWPVNAEMKPYVAETETQLNTYKPADGDYKMLATTLENTNENLVKSCTMTGTPHDNLHAWLAPHMKEIEKLKNAENREEANHIVGELKESMEKYHQHFN
ncbi:hypothetical protein FNJ88_01845 [Chryseobacterium sp. SNU WT5]|uniref:hypothetical protein n=1 Tax=Chryseobacterium sp. SNU WT5 TaxID=2594269 RepID=UPI00117DD0E2|nr:hypothetical protein [Chryseobacterium sp. SNU WT5]QDP84357.1 hypothetical protein FNJ88_01845 [Chryseobacterium sp. SNU WT5]